MAAYQCLNCEEIAHSGEDCCDKPDLLCINDMPSEIKRLRTMLSGHPSDTALLRQALEALEWCEPAGTVGAGGIAARRATIAALKERLK
jgi:hypothetical protein